MSRWAVVLAGGVGSRFWPLSTPERPKQLLPLVTAKPLLRDAIDRLAPIVDPSHTLVLTNASLVKSIRKLLTPIPRENIIPEPRPVGTAAALTWAALAIERRDSKEATMICVHADWAIGDEAKFREALLQGEELARKTHTLVTVGIVPTRADQGFGYIQPARPNDPDGSPVKRFIEKPDRKRAEKMRSEGYLWNSGIFIWSVGDFLAQVREHTPELTKALSLDKNADAKLQQTAAVTLANTRPGAIWLLDLHAKKLLPDALKADVARLLRGSPYQADGQYGRDNCCDNDEKFVLHPQPAQKPIAPPTVGY